MLGLSGASCDLAQLWLPGGPTLELIAFKHEETGEARRWPMAPGMGHIAIRAGHFDAKLAELVALGASPLGVVTQFSAGRAVYLATPGGAFLELQEDLAVPAVTIQSEGLS
jgi:hypothetical protein